ncbi:unnamed protein product [Clonostachys rhizophaga]|uniref:AB hydrolase-1 domain-containing protein n=1 Tax=Clonostachys rhizophaga TaxID=160324 RepID=A0A9N9YC53_9HYPO|nr:unnamed protein product [Clonostachys rhizophaga]
MDSRLEASGVDELARRRGIRVISLDRPGYGLSTTQPNRTIVDWPADVRAFAEGMKLDKFSIIGGSGGGPYALACAHALPREMLAGVGFFASAPPWAAGVHHMSRAQRVMLLSAHEWGFKFEYVGYNQVWIWHGANDANAPIVMIEYLAKRLPHCTLRAFSYDTHFTMFKRLELALDDLFPGETRKKNHNIAMPGRLLLSLLLFH